MSFSGVIFDLDGTLIASERNYLRAWHQAARVTGVNISNELYMGLIGLNRSDTINRLSVIWASDSKARSFVDASELEYSRLVAAEGHVLRPGITVLLDHVAATHRPLAVATSCHRSLALQTLRDTGLTKYFRTVLSGDEVKHGKPDPEIYLSAAARLGIDPRRCVAFEDSNPGAKSALSAGMKVVVIPELEGDTSELTKIAQVIRYSNHAEAVALFV
jgi:HAD superfamily hydrolase (TIGR01509 family)